MIFRLGVILAIVCSLASLGAMAQTKGVSHPLDALTAEEIAKATDLLKKKNHASNGALFAAVSLHEPAKADVLAWKPGDKIPRQAFVIFRDKKRTFEAIVDLSGEAVATVTEKPGVHPMVMDANWIRARDALYKDERYLKALERRGLKPGKTIFCTPNSAGYLAGDDYGGRHILKVPCFSSAQKLHPTLARPIEGLMGIVDAETGEVIAVHDQEVVDLPPAPKGYGDDLPKPDKPLKPAGFRLAGGGNVKLSDNLRLDWHRWSMHLRADKRAGLILSLIDFRDQKSTRRMVYQMHVSELFVPYMDPNPTWAYRTFLDTGEFGLGYLISSLQPGVDCPETAIFRDLEFPNDVGGVFTRPKALCIFERPTGDPAWRHYSSGRKRVTGEAQVELVVRHIPTLGNYDYLIDYIFTPQGSIRVRVGSTGFDAIKSVAAKDMESETAEADTQYGGLIAPYTVAPNHDHYFNFRIDLDVDGTANELVQDSFLLETPDKSSGRASLWRKKTQRYKSEGPIVQDHAVSMAGSALRVVNPGVKTGLKYNPSIWLSAHHSAQSILSPEDASQKRAMFSTQQFWVTRNKPGEYWAAGVYPNLSQVDEGLPRYVADGESIVGEDLVVWYTMGFRHLTRPEDFPILPTMWHELTLRPAYFFDMDPSMTFNSGQKKN